MILSYIHIFASKRKDTAFKIQYKFKEDEKSHTCYVTYDQYLNFRALSIVAECNVLKKNQKEDHEDYMKEVQKAINLLAKNDTSHIRKLSKNV